MPDHKTDIKSTVNSLVKVAEQMIDSVEGQESQKLSPEEALQAIEQIISELEQVASGIPAEGQPSEDVPPVEAPETPDPRVAQLEKEVAQLKAQSEQKDREILAEKIAQFYDKDSSKKFEEIKSSKEPIAVLQARLETLTELADGKVATHIAQKSGFISLQKTAKLLSSEDRRHTL